MILNTVKQFRLEYNITQEALAKKVRVSRQTIIAIEKGNYTPSLELALMLSRVFEAPIEKLFKIK